MTAQSMETIYIDGRKHYMASEPFGDYLETLDKPPMFNAPHTGLWRGYLGRWKIRDDNLFLIGLEGYLTTPESEFAEINLNYFFPDQKEVFAHWFSGELRIPMGMEIQYIHMGYESVFEKDLIMQIENGVVISKTEIENT